MNIKSVTEMVEYSEGFASLILNENTTELFEEVSYDDLLSELDAMILASEANDAKAE